MVVATKLAMFTVGLVLALVAGWGLGHVLGPGLTSLTPPGAPALEEHHPALREAPALETAALEDAAR